MSSRCTSVKHVLALVFLLAATLQIWAVPCTAKFVSIEDIPVGFAENPRYGEIIRMIHVEGNIHTRTWIIKSALKSKVGHPYTEETARKDLLWVSRLGSFTAVAFRVDPVEDGIALTVIVTEATPWLPSLSFKITDENGIEIGPAFTSFNLLGTAARLSAYARFGGATNYGLRYSDPALPVKDWRAGYKLFYFHRERTNELLHFEETSDELFFEFGQPDTEEMNSGLRFRYLYLRADRDSITLSPDNKDKMSSLGFYVQHDSRNAVYPTDGWFIDAEVSKYGLFGGELSDFWRFDMDARFYKRIPGLGPKHSVALYYYNSLVFGELGTTIPSHQEFYIGGTNSVRGWELGVRHGQNQWLNTVEYWYRLMEQKKWKVWIIKWRMGFQIGVFGDLGTAWTEYEDLRENWIGGFGAGFRLSMPVITVVRLDVGYGPNGGVVRFHVGGAEKASVQKFRVR
jgi:outer membrane protein assembly factor BamA